MLVNKVGIEHDLIKGKKFPAAALCFFQPNQTYSNSAVAGIMEKVMIVKIKKHVKNFTITSNEIPQNHGLSLAARGLMSEAISLPGDWELDKGYFVTDKDSKYQIDKIFKELREAGHASIKNIYEYDSSGVGRIKARKWQIYEDSRDNEEFQNSLNRANPSVKEIPQLRKSLSQGNRGVDIIYKQRTKNIIKQRTNNIKEQSTKKYIQKKLSVHEILKLSAEDAEKIGQDLKDFRTFCSIYPKRGGDLNLVGGLRWWHRRLKEGVKANYLISQATYYQVYANNKNQINTEFVFKISNFLGQDELYNEPWEVNANEARNNTPRSISELNEEFRKDHGMGEHAEIV